MPSDKSRIRYIAEKTAEITGLHGFPQYLTLLFEIDSLILNDDRHLNNIAIIEQDGRYDYCPIFDNGAGSAALSTPDRAKNGGNPGPATHPELPAGRRPRQRSSWNPH